jgi:hypothetical protein
METELKGLGGKEGMLSLSTTKFGQAKCSELLYPTHHVQPKNTGEVSIIANVLPLLSPDIAPFVSCIADKTCHRTLQTQPSVLTCLLPGSDLLPQ